MRRIWVGIALIAAGIRVSAIADTTNTAEALTGTGGSLQNLATGQTYVNKQFYGNDKYQAKEVLSLSWGSSELSGKLFRNPLGRRGILAGLYVKPRNGNLVLLLGGTGIGDHDVSVLELSSGGAFRGRKKVRYHDWFVADQLVFDEKDEPVVVRNKEGSTRREIEGFALQSQKKYGDEDTRKLTARIFGSENASRYSQMAIVPWLGKIGIRYCWGAEDKHTGQHALMPLVTNNNNYEFGPPTVIGDDPQGNAFFLARYGSVDNPNPDRARYEFAIMKVSPRLKYKAIFLSRVTQDSSWGDFQAQFAVDGAGKVFQLTNEPDGLHIWLWEPTH